MAPFENPANGPFSLITTPASQLPKDQKLDQFYRCASEMACVHNMVIRGLNSIYLQAPHIQPKDETSFLNYSACFYELLHSHHCGEEKYFFPVIEEVSGEKGIMECNVGQHEAFHDGLEKYNTYVQACLKGEEKYNGAKLVEIIDEFGPTLTTHLSDEIHTLLGLAKYGEKMAEGLGKAFDDTGEKDMKELGLPGALSWGFFNHDVSFEDGLWSNWPPAPAPVVFIVRYITYWLHSDWWKFAPCDRFGRPKEKLYATA